MRRSPDPAAIHRAAGGDAGEEMPDLRLLLRLLERLVERAGDDLDDADGDRFVRAMRLKALRDGG